ncbi:rhamnulokinase [Peptococcaceae bacterium CEB3]|nr:rhamnulokinase [Peptococcaceae bacterium CEB3]
MWRGFAVDLGASNGRTVLGHFNGERLNLEEITRFPNIPVKMGGTLYWNFPGLYGEILKGLTLAYSGGQQPSMMGVDTWGVDFGLLDAHGDLMSNPRHYRDEHNNGMLDEILKRIAPEELYDKTGIQNLQINTICQLMYLSLYKPEVLERAHHLLMFPDLITYFLTGEMVAEFTSVTTTQLYNPHLGTWDNDLILRLGLPRRLFESIVKPLAVVGEVRTDVLDGVNLHGRIDVVAVGQHDTASAVFAVPKAEENYAYISSGTWSLVGTLSQKPIISVSSRRHNFTNEGGVTGNYRVLKNVMGLWLLQEVKRTLQNKGSSLDYSDLVAAGFASKPLQAIIDPDSIEFMAPKNMIDEIKKYCRSTGQHVPVDYGEITRTIFESLALKYRWVLRKLEEIVGKDLPIIYIVGGGVHNEALCQWTADATRKTVVAGPAEATVIGNLAAQLVAARELSDAEEVSEVVKRSFESRVYQPKGERDIWDEAYVRLLRLMG